MDLFDDLPTPKNESCDLRANNIDNVNDKKRTIKAEEEDEEENKNLKKLCVDYSKLKAYVAERQGERDEMEDRHVIIENFLELLKDPCLDIKRVSYYAVFDGHSGSRAAEFCASRMHQVLAERFPKDSLNQVEKDIKRCFIESFKQVDEEFLKLAIKNKPAWKDGTTVTIVIIINDILYSANLGDSKAIIVRTNEKDEYIPIVMTKDHNPTSYEERQRIQKTGAYVKDGRVLGVLEISRSIGDGQYKSYGVSCLPEIKKCQLNSNMKYIVIGCDGLWKSFTNEEVIAFFNKTNKYFLESILQEELPQNKTKQDYAYESSCNKISNEAVKKLTADNVTVLYVSIENQKILI